MIAKIQSPLRAIGFSYWRWASVHRHGPGFHSGQGRLTTVVLWEGRRQTAPIAHILVKDSLVDAPHNRVDTCLSAGDAQLIVVGVTFDSNGAEDFAVFGEQE